ncbi:hypothetical protein Tco_1395601 [Tanacetum coccineum]
MPKRKDIEVPQPSGPTDNVVDEAIYEEMDDSLERASTTATSLVVEQDRGNINKTQSKETLNEPSSLGTSSSSGPRRQETMGDTISQSGFENVGLSRRVESSEDEGLGEEDASKQGRIADIDTNAGINLVSTHFDADTDMFRVRDLVGDEVVVETEVASKDVNLSVDEVTLAASIRPKAKGLIIHEHEQVPTPIVSSQQPSELNVQDKRKGKMVKPDVKKLSKKDQLMLDEELAFKLQAEKEEEERISREKA